MVVEARSIFWLLVLIKIWQQRMITSREASSIFAGAIVLRNGSSAPAHRSLLEIIQEESIMDKDDVTYSIKGSEQKKRLDGISVDLVIIGILAFVIIIASAAAP